GDDLVTPTQHLGVVDADPHILRRADMVGVDTVVNHRDPRPEGLGKGRRLPVGGGDAAVGDIEMKQVVDVLHGQAAGYAGVGAGEFRIEAHVRAAGMVEELAIDAEPGLRPDLLEEQALPPAGMGDDDIGTIALIPQLQRGPEAGFGADHLALEIEHPGMNVRGGAATEAIAQDAHASPVVPRDFLEGQRGDLNPRSGGEGRGQVHELAGEILVDEQYFHGTQAGNQDRASAPEGMVPGRGAPRARRVRNKATTRSSRCGSSSLPALVASASPRTTERPLILSMGRFTRRGSSVCTTRMMRSTWRLSSRARQRC